MLFKNFVKLKTSKLETETLKEEKYDNLLLEHTTATANVSNFLNNLNDNEEAIINQTAVVATALVVANNDTTTCIKIEEDNPSNANNVQLLTPIVNQTSLVSSRTRNKKLNDTKQQSQSNSAKQPTKKTILSYLVESENFRRKQQELQQDGSNHKENNNSKSEQTSITNQDDTNKNFRNNSKAKRNSKKNSRSNINSNKKASDEKIRTKKRSSKTDLSKEGASLKRSSSICSNNSLSNQIQTNSNIQINNNKFSKNALFHSPTSILTKFDLKTLFQPAVFESLPKSFQLKVIKLLPECDRQVDSTGSFKLSVGALTNEFIKKCYIEWQQKLSNGDFGNFSLNNYQSSLKNYDASILNTSTTITRSTRLKQQRLIQSLKNDEFNDDEESLDNFTMHNFSRSYLMLQEDSSFNNNETNDLDQTSEQITNNKFIEDSLDGIRNEINFEENSHMNESSNLSIDTTVTSNSRGSDLSESISEMNSASLLSSSTESTSEETSAISSSDESTETSLVEEDLEAKKRQLHREAKLLLKKNKKLRKNYTLTDDYMIENINKNTNSNSNIDEPVRKSQRKRKSNIKFTDEEYELDESSKESANSNSDETKSKEAEKLEEEKKCVLKLRIKRVPVNDEKTSFSAVLIEESNLANELKVKSEETTPVLKAPINDVIKRTSIDLTEEEKKFKIYSPEISELNIKISPSVTSNVISSPKNVSANSSPRTSLRKINTPITRATSKLLKLQQQEHQTKPTTSDLNNLTDDNSVSLKESTIKNGSDDDDDYEINDDDDEDDEDYYDEEEYEDDIDIPDLHESKIRKCKENAHNTTTTSYSTRISSKKHKLDNFKHSYANQSNINTIDSDIGPRRAKTLSHMRANRKRTIGSYLKDPQSNELQISTSNNKENESDLLVVKVSKETTSKTDSYDLNIDKIVHELKSIGSSCLNSNKDLVNSNQETPSSSPKKSLIEELNMSSILNTRIKKNNLIPVPIFDIAKSASFTRNLLKQYQLNLNLSTSNLKPNVDTSIINTAINENNTLIINELPSISNLLTKTEKLEASDSLILNLNVDLIKKISKHNKKYNKKIKLNDDSKKVNDIIENSFNDLNTTTDVSTNEEIGNLNTEIDLEPRSNNSKVDLKQTVIEKVHTPNTPNKEPLYTISSNNYYNNTNSNNNNMYQSNVYPPSRTYELMNESNKNSNSQIKAPPVSPLQLTQHNSSLQQPPPANYLPEMINSSQPYYNHHQVNKQYSMQPLMNESHSPLMPPPSPFLTPQLPPLPPSPKITSSSYEIKTNVHYSSPTNNQSQNVYYNPTTTNSNLMVTNSNTTPKQYYNNYPSSYQMSPMSNITSVQSNQYYVHQHQPQPQSQTVNDHYTNENRMIQSLRSMTPSNPYPNQPIMTNTNQSNYITNHIYNPDASMQDAYNMNNKAKIDNTKNMIQVQNNQMNKFITYENNASNLQMNSNVQYQKPYLESNQQQQQASSVVQTQLLPQPQLQPQPQPQSQPQRIIASDNSNLQIGSVPIQQAAVQQLAPSSSIAATQTLTPAPTSTSISSPIPTAPATTANTNKSKRSNNNSKDETNVSNQAASSNGSNNRSTQHQLTVAQLLSQKHQNSEQTASIKEENKSTPSKLSKKSTNDEEKRKQQLLNMKEDSNSNSNSSSEPISMIDLNKNIINNNNNNNQAITNLQKSSENSHITNIETDLIQHPVLSSSVTTTYSKSSTNMISINNSQQQIDSIDQNQTVPLINNQPNANLNLALRHNAINKKIENSLKKYSCFDDSKSDIKWSNISKKLLNSKQKYFSMSSLISSELCTSKVNKKSKSYETLSELEEDGLLKLTYEQSKEIIKKWHLKLNDLKFKYDDLAIRNNKPNEASATTECHGDHKAMIECQMCGYFCHIDCVYMFESNRYCKFCFKQTKSNNENDSNEIELIQKKLLN